MNQPTGLRTRLECLEDTSVPRGVVGIVTPRGGTLDPAEQQRGRQRIENLLKAGHGVVCVANLANLAGTSTDAPAEPGQTEEQP